MPTIEVAGNNCLRKPRPTKGCRTDGDVVDDDDDERTDITKSVQYIHRNADKK